MASRKESTHSNVGFVSEFASHNGNHILAVYKGLEATLKDSKKMYQDKVNALLAAWEHVTTFIATSAQDSAQDGLIEWVHRHTLNVVLQGDWPKLSPATKTHLSVTLQRCATLLSSHNAAPKFRMLVKLVNDPWGHPILKRIISGSPEITDEEVLDLCHSEMGMVLTMRLEKLCESRCEDLALRLAEVIIRCLSLDGSRLREGSTEDQISYILDVYVSLLYRFKRIQDIIKYLKRLELKDGLLLIRRYAKKDTMSIRIWKQSAKVAELAAQYFLTVAMVKPVSETGSLLKDLMAEWAILHSRMPSTSTLPNMIRKLILPAESAIHIYTFCEVLVQQFGDILKPICIELYIRGLTTDMNELEQQKVKHDKEKVHEAELRLSDGFLRLAELVKDNVGVCRECILTAFSLNPTRSCFDKIKAMAVASGKCPNPEKIRLEQSVSKNNNATVIGEVKDDFIEKKLGKSDIQVDTGQVSNASDTANSVRMILNPIDTNVNSEKEIDNRERMNFSHDPSSSETLPSGNTVPSLRGKSVSSEGSRGPSCSCKPHRSKDPLLVGAKDSLESKSLEIFASCSGEQLGDLCPHCGKFIGGRSTSTSRESIETSNSVIGEGINTSTLTKKSGKTDSLDYDVLRQPNKVLDAEALGLTPQLCDDLAVVLSSPRYQTLSWVLDWSDLSTRCEKYLENCEEMRNTAKELKFLNIDYNQFKDWPSDEEKDNYGGIEKGYEQWAELSSDPSDHEYEYPGYKKHQRQCESESDSSVIRKGSKGRGRKSTHRLVSSESDYESGGTKKTRQRVTSLSISDTDTGTQDSKTDSLGSDGFAKVNKDKLRKNEEPVAAKRYRQDNLKDLSHFRVMMDEDRSDGNSDLSNSDVMSLLTQMDENGKSVANKYSHAFDSSRRDDILNQTEKKSSDPTVLKSLRMFRPHNAKKSLPRDCLTEMLKGNRVHTKDSVEFAPMLSTLNLNPRIVLTRTDAAHPDLKNFKNQSSNNNHELHCRKNNSNNKNIYVVNKNQFPLGFPMTGDMKSKHRLQFITQSVIDSELLAKSVPGLNSLDMIVPAPSEPTVQVVQLPQNPTASNQTVNSSDANQSKVQSSNASTATSSSNFLDATASSSDRDLGPQPTYSSQDREHNQSFVSHSGQHASCTTQEKDKLSSAQVSVKYLTKANEVNDILRSSLGGLSQSVTSLSSQGGSLMEKKHNYQTEVKYLTSTSEVNEILRSTLIDSSAHSQSSISHSSSEGNLPSKTRLDTEVKYLTTANEVNEILRSTPVTAHIQKIGQPPVASDIEQNSNSIPHADTSQASGQSFPIVKAVDLNLFASLISSVGSTSQSVTDSQSSVQDSHMVQFLYKKDGQKFHIKPVLCTQSNSRVSLTENSNSPSAQNSTNASASPMTNDQQQNSLAHALFEDNFRKYSLNSNVTVKATAEGPEQSLLSQVASLPKFQHAFGKSIYNQTGTDGNNPQITPTSSREEGSRSTSASTSENVEQIPQPMVSSTSTVLSKAVQTTGIANTSGSAALTRLTQGESSAAGTLNVLMSPLALSAAGQVVALAQGTVPRSVAGALKRPARAAVTRVQSPSQILYDLQQIPSSIENQLLQPSTTSSLGSSPRNLSLKQTSQQQPQELEDATSSTPVTPVTPATSVTSVTPVSASVCVTNKDNSVIRNNVSSMSALLAAALQGTPQNRSGTAIVSSTLSSPSHSTAVNSASQLSGNLSTSNSITSSLSSNSNTTLSAEPEVCIVESSSSDEEGTDAATQTLISSVPMVQRIALPVLQKSGGRTTVQTRVVRPVLQIPGGNLLTRSSAAAAAAAVAAAGAQAVSASTMRQQVPHASAGLGSSVSTASNITARLSTTVGTTDTLMAAHNTIEPSVSSTTLEQLREFESVLEQVTNTSQMKERNTVQPQTQTETISTQQLLLTPAPTTADPSSEFTSNTASSSASSFPQQFSTVTTTRVAYVSQAPTLRSSSTVPGSASKISSPLVVVTSYCQPVTSPALSVTSQSSSSPCVTPAPMPSASTNKTPPKPNKSSKSKSLKSSPSSTASKASPVPKPQQKPQEDEQTAQRIYAILDEYAEQLRNSPDLNNKPAPRRRSNPPTNPSQSSKRKKSSQTKMKLLGHQTSSSAVEMSPGADDPRTMGSEDSSSGVMQLSHIQDSPASATTITDEPQAAHTPSVELPVEGPSTIKTEPPETAVSTERQQPRIIQIDTAGIQSRVIMQDSGQDSSEVTVSSATVLTGKPVALPLYMPSGVRQVFVPMTPGLTASVGGRKVVMSQGGAKVIRVHQVTLPGGTLQVTPGSGTLQVAPGSSGVQGTALVVRQICGNKASGTMSNAVSVLGQPTVKQVKLPVGSISSQALTGVTAQPPVVLPPGSHHLAGQVTGVVPTALSFTDANDDSNAMDTPNRVDSRLISAEDGASSSSTDNLISRRGQSPFQQGSSFSAASVSDKTSFSNTAQISPNSIKVEEPDEMHDIPSSTHILPVLKTEEGLSCDEVKIKKEPGTECSDIVVGCIKTEPICIKEEPEPDLSVNQSSVTYQCLNIGFSRPVALRNSNNLQECLGETCDISVSKSSDLISLPPCSESESDNAEDSLPGHLRRIVESPAENVKRRIDVGLPPPRESLSSVGGGSTGSSGHCSSSSSSSNSTTPVHSLDKIPNSQLLDTAPSTSQVLQADPLAFPSSAANTMDSNSLSEELFSQEAARVSMTTQVLKKEEDFVSGGSARGETVDTGNRTIVNQNMHSQSALRDSFCATSSGLDGSAAEDLHLRVAATDLQLQRASGVNTSKLDSSLSKNKDCRSNPTHMDFVSDIGYISSSKFPYQLEYVNDVTYQLPSKLPAETRETPWRYVPVVKRVQLIQMRKSDLDGSSDQLGPALQLGDNSEVEDSPQEPEGCLLDFKPEPLPRKSAGGPSTALYRKIDGPSPRLEKPVGDMQQKIMQMEKEMKLQKSLSEECEDLGVDEPSTSDLFPEADLLLDTNSSPPFEQNIQDAAVTSDVQTTDSFSCSNFRSLEYSSSSQDGSQQGSPIDFKRQEGSRSPRRMRKRTAIDWKSRATGREKSRHLNSSSHSHRESKLHSLAQDCSINGSSHKDSVIHGTLSNIQEDSSNGGSKDDLSESTSGTSVQEAPLTNSKKLRLEKEDEDHETVLKHSLSQKSIVNSLCIANKDLQVVGESASKEGVLSETGNLKSFGVVASKVSLPSSPRTNTYSGSSEDLVNMLDTYASHMMLSSLDVTIPSPVPSIPSLTAAQAQGSACPQESLPTLTAAQKFSNTYGKRALSGRQDVDRVVKRTRLHRPNQYFNDHIDSQETWESSSSQEKTCADDEDSGSQSRTEGQSTTPDQPNSDVDVVDISNDSFPSSTTTTFLPTSTSKVGVSSSDTFDKAKPLNLNGIDLKESFSFSVQKDLTEGKKVPNNKRATRKTVEADTCATETSLTELVGKRRRSGSRSNMSPLQKLKSVFQLKPSKAYVPTKQAPNLSNFSENRKLIVRARKVEECGYLSSVAGFNKPAATAVTPPEEEADGLISPRAQLLDKDSICPVASPCETQLNTLSVSRRSSLRGHIKKGCTCCSVSPQPAKKKKEVLKVEKTNKKGQIKGTVTKKR